jgi:hypothetical protein
MDVVFALQLKRLLLNNNWFIVEKDYLLVYAVCGV